MDLLITGGSGLVGWDLVRRAAKAGHGIAFTYHDNEPEVTADGRITSYQLDIRDADRVHEIVREVGPEAVAHAAAMTDVDECERHPQRAEAVNVSGTEHVATAAETVDASLLLYSTAFVFDGSREVVVPDDPRRAVNHYGKTKIRAEDRVIDASVESTVCRLDQPYDWSEPWQSDTFVSWILDRCSQGDSFPVFTDWYNTPVYVPDLNEAVLTLLESDRSGIYHSCGPDHASRYEWARLIANQFGHDPELVEEGHSSEAGLPADRPNVCLLNDEFQQKLGITFRSLEEGLRELQARRT